MPLCAKFGWRLLEADVNYKVAKDFVESVRAKAEGQEVWQDLKPHEQVVKIVYDELVESDRRNFVAARFYQADSERRDDRRSAGFG